MNHYDTPLYLIEHKDGWKTPEILIYWERYVRTILKRYKGRVKYWLPFNEINATIFIPYMGAGLFPDVEKENFKQSCYQCVHYQLVANAIAKKCAKEIDPNAQIGCMICPLYHILLLVSQRMSCRQCWMRIMKIIIIQIHCC